MTDKILAILPQPADDSRAFWDGCNQQRLLLPQCDACDAVFYYPRSLCPVCGSERLSWLESAGAGRVFSFTRVEVSFYGTRWESQLPYVVLLVSLAEGPRMVSRLIGATNGLCVGAPVQVEFVLVENQRLPFFRIQPVGEHE